MRRRDKIDILDAVVDQAQKDISQLLRCHCFALPAVTDGLVLAKNTPQGAAGKKDRAAAEIAGDHRLLPIVGRGASGIERGGHMAKAKLARGPVDVAAAGAELASFVIQHSCAPPIYCITSVYRGETILTSPSLQVAGDTL